MNNLEKEFVPYEPSLDMKELGFDEPCFMFYEQGTSNKYLQKGIDDNYWGDYSEPRDWNSIPNKPWKPFCQCISAPLYQQAFRWFREKHGIFVSIVPNRYGSLDSFIGWIYVPLNGSTKDINVGDYKIGFNTPEEAELECLKKLIEITKTK